MSTLHFLAKFFGMLATGLAWVLTPSILIYALGLMFQTANPLASAANALVFWILIHILVLVFNRVSKIDMKKVVEDYHDEYISLQQRVKRKTGEYQFDSMKSLRRKLEE